jgi:hypothetical protein
LLLGPKRAETRATTLFWEEKMGAWTTMVIEQPGQFFDNLAGLHDVRIDRLTIETDECMVRLSTENLLPIFSRSEDYPGDIPCDLLFHNVQTLRCGLSFEEGLRITSITVSRGQSGFNLEIFLNLGVLFEDLSISPIQIECETVSVFLYPDEKVKLEKFLRAI